jgi:hypothetical protein
VLRVLVEHVERRAQHLRDLDRQVLLDRAERRLRGLVQIVDFEGVVGIGGHNGDGHAVDHRHEPAGLVLLDGDVGGELDHPHRLAGGVEDRIVGCLQPNPPPVPIDPGEFARRVLAAAQPRPEGGVIGARDVIRVAEHPVMLAHDLVEPVADHRQEVPVGVQNRPIHREFDGGQRSIESIELRLSFIMDRLPKHSLRPRASEPSYSPTK